MTTSRSVAALLLSAAWLSAQEPPLPAVTDPAALRTLRTPIHTQPDDEGHAYGIWAAGADYKVSFHGGMRFVPYAGPVAVVPDVAWRTASVRVGPIELATQPPLLRTSSWRAEYDLGGVVEAYDVRAEGVEQTFVLARRPAAGGDLTIRGEVGSPLAPVAGRGHRGIDFVDAAARTVVRYGAAVAYDANGARCDVTASVVGGGIELRLAGEWLAAARFPVVVDPLLAATNVAAGAVVTEVAVAHDPFGTMNVWVAETRVVGTDTDLRLFRTEENGTNPTVVYSDLSALFSSIEPSLGVNRPSQTVALAFTRHLSNDTRRVRAHVHGRADTGFDASTISVPNLVSANQWRPSVGSELSPFNVAPLTSLLVAYQREDTGAFVNTSTSAIEAVLLQCSSVPTFVDQFTIATGANLDYERPTVAKVSVGTTREWTVGYQKYVNVLLGGNWDVALRRVDGSVVGGEFVVDGSQARHEMAPRLAGVDGRLLLVYTASTTAELPGKPAGANGHRIRGSRVDWSGAGFTLPHGSRELQTENDARLELGGLDHDHDSDSHWGLSFRSNVTENVYFRTYGYTGAQLTSDLVESPSVAIGTTVAGGVAFQSNDDEFVIAYGVTNPPANSLTQVRRKTYPSLVGVTSSGSACTATDLAWNGPRWIGTETCSIAFTNAPANSFTALAVATATASVQLFGIGGVQDGCWLLLPLSGPDYLGLLGPIVGSSGAFPLPLPEGLTNMTLRFQAITFDGNTGQFTSSSRLNVPIGK
jgi:hypothetical protein